MGDLDQWLRHMGLELYAELFAKEHVTLDILPLLGDHHLKELGIPLGHRVKLLNGLRELRHSSLAHAARGSGRLAGKPALDTARRPLTVMFCDLVNSIVLSRQHGPEAYRDVLDAYRRTCSGAVERYGGFIARTIGDGILAYYGYPRAHEDDAERALRAALEIVTGIGGLATQFARGDRERLAVRVALASGEVIVGDIVSGGASEIAAATGDAPNLAARLQALAAPNTIMLDQATRDRAGGQFEYQDVGAQNLKGFAEPVQAWIAVGERSTTRFEARKRNRIPFVGREKSLSSLMRLWECARAGSGRVGIISGRAGIGKSRLIEEVRQRAIEQMRGAAEPRPLVMRLQCFPYYSDTPLHPIVRSIEHVARFERDDPPLARLSKLRALIDRTPFDVTGSAPALLSDLLGLQVTGVPAVDMSPREKRLRQLELLLAWLRSVASTQPVLLTFEDLQWIDPTSKELLEQMVSTIGDVPVLVLATLRTESQSWRSVQASSPSAHWLSAPGIELHELAELSEDEALRMMLDVAGRRELPGKIAEAIAEKGQGIPLFIEELTHAWLVSSGQGVEDGLQSADAHTIAIPDSLSSALMARIDQLGSVKDLALQASVIGREFSTAFLSKVSQIETASVQVSLDRLAGAEILVPAGAVAEPTYRFKHALIQDEAYASLLDSRRRRIHLNVAKALEQERSLRPEIPLGVIAEHYAKDTAPGRAIELWREAAAQSVARSAHHEAASMLQRALDMLPELEATSSRVMLELVLTTESAAALRAIRGYASPQVEERYGRAHELCTRADAPNIQFNVEWGLFQYNLVKGDLASADEFAERLQLSSSSLPDAFRADAHLANGMVKLHQGSFESARVALEHAAALTDPTTDVPRLLTHGQNAGIFCRSNLAHTLAFLGHIAQARALAEENLAIARRRKSEPSQQYTYVNALAFASRVYVLLREPATVYRISDELIQIARRNRYSYYEAIALAQIGWARSTEAASRAQIDAFATSIRAVEATGTELAVRGFYAQLAGFYASLGDKDAAQQAIEKATSAGDHGTRTWDVEIERVKSLIAALEPMSDPIGAEAAFKASLDCAHAQRSRTQELRTTVSYAAFLTGSKRSGDARELLESCLLRLPGCTEMADAAMAREFIRRIDLEKGD